MPSVCNAGEDLNGNGAVDAGESNPGIADNLDPEQIPTLTSIARAVLAVALIAAVYRLRRRLSGAG